MEGSVQFFEEARGLSHLSLNIDFGTVFFMPNAKSCTNLVSVYFQQLSVAEFIPLLVDHCNTLRHIQIEDIIEEAPPYELKTADFPHLETLVLRVSYEGVLEGICSVF
ncbi:hypothetical protein CPB83DRAFT_865424 [Crepidotus variabilis]|uniref:Uncharacterized protein n=1 Tax=Crepidotus variabilis TaxID=179855 RepID=A0A9P6E2Z2_9AGAR|nr:hypothetical protein CPB83DRAFT_865424 [Crepidotus variabilis]